MIITDRTSKKTLFSILLIFAIIVIILGFVFNPSFVTKYLSPDGVLGKPTIIDIYAIDFFLITFGFIIFAFSLFKVIKNDYARIIDEKLTEYANKIDNKIRLLLIYFKFVNKDDSPLVYRTVFIWIIFLLTIMVSELITVICLWQNAKGWEYLWVAQNIESGHGFSLSSCNRWIAGIIDYPNCKQHLQLTAYIEPGYSFFMAFMTKVFGKYGRLAVLVFQVVALFLTSIVIYHIARKILNAATGIVAGLILSMLPSARNFSMFEYTPAIFAGLLISFSIYLLFWCLEKISVRRSIALGFMLGFSSLIYSPILPFIPLMAFFVLISKRPFMLIQFSAALVIVVTAITVMSPWSIRNLLLFDHFIPLRSGFGANIYEVNPILAATFSSEAPACSDKLGPLWKVQNAEEAVKVLRNTPSKRSMVLRRGLDCIEEIAPDGFKEYNEVEIDNFRQQKTLEFILSQPKIFSSLAYHRIKAFFIWGWKNSAISLLFVIGALMTLRNQKSRIVILFVLGYVSTYLLVAPLFFRYRYPIEPIILVYASYLPVLIVSKFYTLSQRNK